MKIIHDYIFRFIKTVHNSINKRTHFALTTLPNLNYSEHDQINDQISDQINDRINDLGLLILHEFRTNPGIKVPGLVERLSAVAPDINADKVRNEIKRELKNHIELRGSRKIGGYYLRKE